MRYTYNLHPQTKPKNATYTREELNQLTTLQLREICRKEKIVIGVAYKLDREYIIETILKYRGKNPKNFINTYKQDKFEALIEQYNSRLNFIEGTKDIQIPARIVLYKEINTTIYDKHIIKGKNLVEGNVFLLNENKEICGILNCKKLQDKLYLVCNHKLLKEDLKVSLYKNYSLGFLDNRSSKYIYDFYYKNSNQPYRKLNVIVKPISELIILDTINTNTFLVIDFGTSNSAVGAYLDKNHVDDNKNLEWYQNSIDFNNINKVKFSNVLLPNQAMSEIIPTVVSIKDCSDPDNIVYRFGYDALKHARKNSYNTPQTVFYGIKNG
ncbi:hypothetical protein [Defluviitalea phaphyphila]|uniref:hypothetical protein n=1 Tax=Defluviitalea phaphyphila TaxID=1473580 RepID=UPI000730F70A|nr:hypothetical protein [Defluviitalea phaphyphila]